MRGESDDEMIDIILLLQILDARDPLGTRSKYIEQYLKREKPHKHLILLLNKCDLVPTWVTVSQPLQHALVTSRIYSYCHIHCPVTSIILSHPLSCHIHCPVTSIILSHPLSCHIHYPVTSIVLSHPLSCHIHCPVTSIVLIVY